MQWGWESPGSHSVLTDVPFLSRVPNSCLGINLGAFQKVPSRVCSSGSQPGMSLPPEYLGTYLVVTAGLVPVVGCC